MPVGLHAVYETSYISALERAAALGFDYVQFDLNVPGFYIDEISKTDISNIKRTAKREGVGITFHAPGDNIGLFTDYPEIRSGMLKHFARIMNIAEELEARHVTFHPLWPPSFKTADTHEDLFGERHFGYFKKVLTENLLALCEGKHVYACIENHRIDSVAMAALNDSFILSETIALTLDIPKTLTISGDLNQTLLEFYGKNLARLKEVHLHDRDEQGRTHLAPGQGLIDFSRFAEFLAIEDAWITVEVRPAELAAAAIPWLRSFRDSFGR